MNMLAKFIAVSAGIVGSAGGPAHAQTMNGPFLNLEERETILTYHARNKCLEDSRAAIETDNAQYRNLLQIREGSIRAQAEKMARQISDSSMHIIISGALSEGLTQDQAAYLVETMREADQRTLRAQLERLVKLPDQPPTLDEFCADKLNIDTNSFGRRVRSLTEKHGINVLTTPEIR